MCKNEQYVSETSKMNQEFWRNFKFFQNEKFPSNFLENSDFSFRILDFFSKNLGRFPDFLNFLPHPAKNFGLISFFRKGFPEKDFF